MQIVIYLEQYISREFSMLSNMYVAFYGDLKNAITFVPFDIFHFIFVVTIISLNPIIVFFFSFFHNLYIYFLNKFLKTYIFVISR